MMPFEQELREELTGLAGADRLRHTRVFAGRDRAHPTDSEGRRLLSFATNDYLGLAGHPALSAAASAEAEQNGYGSGASRLVSGEGPAHLALEQDLANFLGAPSVLLFPTGYQTNMGVLTSLAGPSDLIVSDAANHASVIDGCRLSRARVVIYPHGDSEVASLALETRGSFRRRILVTESIFSMDGDRAPLLNLAAAVRKHEAVLVVDEAHAIGVAGPEGRGLCAEHHIVPDVLIGTLGKSLGTSGGFAAGSDALRSFLINRARSFIFATAAPMPCVAATRAALALATGPDGQRRRERSNQLAARLRSHLLRAGLQPLGADLLVPIILGSERDALAVSDRLFADGILAPAIRPPTVPAGTSRLRITISAAHDSDDVDRLAAALIKAIPPSGRPGPALP